MYTVQFKYYLLETNTYRIVHIVLQVVIQCFQVVYKEYPTSYLYFCGIHTGL